MPHKDYPNPKTQASGRPAANVADQKRHEREDREARQDRERRDEQNTNRFVDQTGEVAQDLPGAEHGKNAVDHPSQIDRNLPHQHGGIIGEEGGTRGDRNLGDADDHGGRKRN